jgi:hypothetical protein
MLFVVVGALTNSTELGYFWQTSGRLTAQENNRLLWNSNVHYSVHKSQQLDSVLRYIDIVHAPLSLFL